MGIRTELYPISVMDNVHSPRTVDSGFDKVSIYSPDPSCNRTNGQFIPMPPAPEASLRVQVNGFTKKVMSSGPTSSNMTSGPPANVSSGTSEAAFHSVPSTSSLFHSPLTPASTSGENLGFPSDAALREAVRLVNPSMNSPSTSRANPADSVPSVVAAPSHVQRSASQNTEVIKRRTLADKIGRMKERDSLHFFIPQCEQMTGVQLGMHLRRFNKKNGTAELTQNIQRRVFEEDDVPSSMATRSKQPAVLVNPLKKKNGFDPDATDISDVELNADEYDHRTSHYLLMQRIALRSQDSRVRAFIEEKNSNRTEISHADSFEFAPVAQLEVQDGESCVRIRPWINRGLRRQIVRNIEPPSRRVDYSLMEPSTSSDVSRYSSIDSRISRMLGSHSEDIPISRRIEAYIHEVSNLPAAVRRRRTDASVWKNFNEIEEENERCGKKVDDSVRKGRGRPTLSKKASGPILSELSSSEDDHEIISDSEGDYRPDDGKRTNGKRDRKRKKRRRPLEERESVVTLAKLGRRNTVPTAPKKAFDIDDVVMDYGADFGISGLPQKIEYKEIAIPGFRKVDPAFFMKYAPVGDDPTTDLDHRAHIALLHKELLEKERQLVVTRQRSERLGLPAASISSLGSESRAASLSPSGEAAPLSLEPADRLLRDASFFESPSIAAPFPPRKFLNL